MGPSATRPPAPDEGPSALVRGPVAREGREALDTTGRTSLHTVTAVVTGLTALTAYAGVVGLIGGGISFGAAVDARLPFGSLWLGGLALLVVVAAPMSVASVAAWRARPRAPDVVVGAGIALVAWIGIELAFIQVYSWFTRSTSRWRCSCSGWAGCSPGPRRTGGGRPSCSDRARTRSGPRHLVAAAHLGVPARWCLGVRRWESKSTWTRPQRSPNPRAHSKLSTSDHTW